MTNARAGNEDGMTRRRASLVLNGRLLFLAAWVCGVVGLTAHVDAAVVAAGALLIGAAATGLGRRDARGVFLSLALAGMGVAWLVAGLTGGA
jgi:hypothetical protein